MYISEKESIKLKFTFTCARGVAEERALVDSGTTENFMDRRMVQWLGIGLRKLPEPRRVFNVDGTENQAGALTEYCVLRVKKGEQEALQRFYITGLGSDHAILGYPWLREFNPSIDWTRGAIRGAPVHIETALFKWARKRTLARIIEAARREEAWEEGDEIIAFVRPLPRLSEKNEPNKHKQPASEIARLLGHYQSYARLFDEEVARRFPPARPEDHVIRIKPGAPSTINAKVYPLTRVEAQAEQDFINKNKELGRIQNSDSPWGVPFFFRKKKDGSLRPIQDY
jgi:hypothetical protein